MVKIRVSENSKWWLEFEETGPVILFEWECGMV